MKVLEITRFGLFKALWPDTTEWIRWGTSLTADEPLSPDPFDARRLLSILRNIRGGSYDLVVLPAVHPDHRFDEPWHKLVAKSCLHRGARFAGLSGIFNRLLRSVPHIIVDMADTRSLCETTVRLFPRHTLYFKRELDLGSAVWPQGPDKVRPLTLFVPNEAVLPPLHEKTIDVFFAASVCNEVRSTALAEAERLARRGYRVVTALNPLPYAEFMATLARSWLVLSPEGYGWDCYRHYESCVAGSVPVISYPRYCRRLYLRDGIHCFYYDLDWPPLADRLVELLADKDRLAKMGEAARHFVLAHHTRSALARYILQEMTAGPASAAPRALLSAA